LQTLIEVEALLQDTLIAQEFGVFVCSVFFSFFIRDWGARKWKGFGWVNLLTKGHQRAWRPRKIHVYQDFFQSMNLMRSFSFSLCQTHLSAAMGLKENKESKIKQVPLSNKEANSQNLWPDLPQQLLHLINST
jgi:hypothetical protein